MKKIIVFILKHKIYSLIILAVLAGGGYYGYQKYFSNTATVRYITTAVTRGALITSISGTGQVSAYNQVDITSKASGSVISVSAKTGQAVKSGTIIASIDSSDALKTYRDAKTSLETAELNLKKIKEPPTELEILQAENSLAQTKESKQQAEVDYDKSYESGFNTVTNAFLDLPALMTGLKDLLYGNDLSSGQSNIDWYANSSISAKNTDDNYAKTMQYRNDVNVSYSQALISYNKNFNNYKLSSRSSSTSTINDLISETYETTKLIANTVKNANNYLDWVQDAMENFGSNVNIPTIMTTHQSALDTYTSKTNSHLVNLLSIEQSLESARQSIVNYDRSIAEKTLSFENLKAGADALEIRAQEISVQKAQDTLAEASSALADYSIRAPFDGILASVGVVKGDLISSGKVAATIITEQKIATITLNEVDAAKVKVGQKVTLTFDAVEDLTITGAVAEVDTLGTVNSGVVSYEVKIAFDVQDERVKSGMSVTASIILDSKPDVILVKSSAVKTQGGVSYVEILVNGSLQQKNVTIGSSNDTMTEIVSGLSENEEIITQTIAGNVTKTTSASTGNTTRSSVGGNSMMMLGGGPAHD
ncbi:MAG: efflux RND transporter periplasmic adaptor subunit [Candidatus Magasanikbacteria bacterium]